MDITAIKSCTEVNSHFIKVLAEICTALNASKPVHPGPRPEKPIAATITEYNQYAKEAGEYNQRVIKHDKHADRLDKKRREVKNIIKLLPANIWIINDENTHAVARHWLDWGGGQDEVKFEINYNGVRDMLPRLKS